MANRSSAKTKETAVGTQSANPESASGVAVLETINPPRADEEQVEIARLAYSYWEARGCCGGSPEEDWYRAEDDLRKGATAARPTESPGRE